MTKTTEPKVIELRPRPRVTVCYHSNAESLEYWLDMAQEAKKQRRGK